MSGNNNAPNFSPISTFHRKVPVGASSSRKTQQSSAASSASTADATNRPKYQCPGCQVTFAKWSPCLSHLREKRHVSADLLDKKLNGGDFRRVQEMCATLAYHQRGGRERTDSGSSFESLSSDSGGEEDEPGSTTAPVASASSSRRALKQRFTPVGSSLMTNVTSRSSSSSAAGPTSNRRSQQLSKSFQGSGNLDLRKLDEKVIFRILTFLDVDSSRMLFLAVTLVPPSVPSPAESRVRLWSVSSDPDSASLPSASPQSLTHKRLTTPPGSSRFDNRW